MEKLCNVLEMELKTQTPVSQKFVFEKIKFKFLHYIQHNFIQQRPEFSNDQISMFYPQRLSHLQKTTNISFSVKVGRQMFS